MLDNDPMNMLLNSIIDESALVRMASFGGPYGTAVVCTEGTRFPYKEIEKMYREYDDEWGEKWNEAVKVWA